MKKYFSKFAIRSVPAAFAWLFLAFPMHAKLNVVATLPDFASIAQEVGGDKITVASLVKGPEDAHFVDARPSFITLLNRADLLIEGGLELEIGWLPPLVNNARNRKILPGSPGYINASAGIRLLDVPNGQVDRSQGDVHPLGNPHFWTDPANGKLVAAQLAEVFGRLDPPNASVFTANALKFNARLDQKIAEWSKAMEPYRGTKVITYHKSFEYFAKRFGLEIAGQLEPKPGIEPSPTHINALIPQAKAAGVRLILIEPFRPRKTAAYVADAIGAKLVLLPEKVGGHEKVQDYFALFDYNVSQIVAALKELSRGATATER